MFQRIWAKALASRLSPLLGIPLSPPAATAAEAPQVPGNVVIFIGDGMGFEQVKAAGGGGTRQCSMPRLALTPW